MKIIQHIKDRIAGKIPAGKKRSDHWPTVRKNFLEQNPVCEVCRGSKKLEVHHRMPFHLHPQLELEPSNLITLCESGSNGANCHLLYGHLGNFKSFNTTVAYDAQVWNQKLRERPKG